METQFVDFLIGLVRAKTGAPGEFFGGEMEHRPVLNAVQIHR
jgi:hypothetical protein